jgi:hypothetical protein
VAAPHHEKNYWMASSNLPHPEGLQSRRLEGREGHHPTVASGD